MPDPNYRYFLGFRPDPGLRARLAALGGAVGQADRRVRPIQLHLTLCVIAELAQRDRFIAARVGAALAERALASCPIRLGRVRGGAGGVALHSLGTQREIRQFYNLLVACLAERGLVPLHRRSGLHPHVTLGYDRCSFEPFITPCEWVPDEILLIESWLGRGFHKILGRWPLLPSPQGELPFDGPLRPFPPLATGGNRLAA